MVASAKDTSNVPNDPFGMAAWLQGTAGLTFHPMMAQTTAMAVAATAIGMSVSSQLAGSFFGALQGAAETMRKSTADVVPEAKVAPVEVVQEAVVETVEAIVPPPVVETVAQPVIVAKPNLGAKIAAKPKSNAKPKLAVVAAPIVNYADLKQIGGIGPKLEQVLNDRGVVSLVAIAGWDETKAGEVDQVLGLDGRILKEDWIGQAKALIAL